MSIFAGNARLLAAVLAAILVAQSPWLAGRDAARGPVDERRCTAAVDSVLALAVAVNVALVGAALGAYGTRMARRDAAARAARARRLRARPRPLPAGAARAARRAPRPRRRRASAWAGWRSPRCWRPSRSRDRRRGSSCSRCSPPRRWRSAPSRPPTSARRSPCPEPPGRRPRRPAKQPRQAAAPDRRSQRAAGRARGAPAPAHRARAVRRSPVESAPRLLGISLPLLIAVEVAVGDRCRSPAWRGALIARRVRGRGGASTRSTSCTSPRTTRPSRRTSRT